VSDAALSGAAPSDVGRRGRFSWALYDWANSPYTTLIITFVFNTYFAKVVIGNELEGQAAWGVTMGIASACVAVLSPFAGAIADARGQRKPWLLFFTMLCAAGATMLWFAEPVPGRIPWIMATVVLATIGFEFGTVFYNAMLGDVARPGHVGRLSGLAWGFGYAGGLTALAVALVGFVMTDRPWFGLGKDDYANIRIVGPLCGLWLLAFSWPLFAFTPERPASTVDLNQTLRAGLKRLFEVLRDLRHNANLVRFLIANMLYTDGLVTVFAFGGIYASGVFGFTLTEVIIFGIVLNVTGGIGCVAFGWLDDRVGPRRTLQYSVFGLLVCTLAALLAPDRIWFWIAGSGLGVFVGPAQAAGRSLMTRLAPANERTALFGVYALAGKATAFVGPSLVAILTTLTGNQRWGLAGIALFFLLGWTMLATVKEVRA